MLRNVSKKVLTAVVLASMTFGSVPVFAATQQYPRMGQEQNMENIKKPEKKSASEMKKLEKKRNKQSESEMRRMERNRNDNRWEENRRSDSNTENSNDGLGKISTKYTRAMERAKRQKEDKETYNRERKDFKKIRKNKNNDGKKYEDWKETKNKRSDSNMSETHRYPANGYQAQR